MNQPDIRNDRIPEPQDALDDFYRLITRFLVTNKLESSLHGFSNEVIRNYEATHAVKFPKAYRLFLSLMAKSDLKIFDGQDFSISGLKDAQSVSAELLGQDNYQLAPHQFVFAQWQGYNFYYFDLRSDNPPVELYIEAGCATPESPPEIHRYGKFTDWLCKKIEINLNLRKQLQGLETDNLLKELEDIRSTIGSDR